MSQVRDIELKIAYQANNINKTALCANKYVDFWFPVEVSRDQLIAIGINNKYVVIARYDENQYSSPPNMRIFGIFSSMDKAKDDMAVWAINRGFGNEMLATCTYDWVMIDEMMV